MIRPAAGHNRSLFQRAQTRRGLARIHDFGRIFSNRFHVFVGQRRNPGESLQEIQSHPFGSKNTSGRALNLKNRFAAEHSASVR